MARSIYLVPALVVALGVAASSLFTVDEREKALILQFGELIKVQEKPGLYFKLPLVQNVVKYDDRILSLPTQPIEVTPLDDRRLVVDAFARWRISDVVAFRQAVGADGIRLAETRLSCCNPAGMSRLPWQPCSERTLETIIAVDRRQRRLQGYRRRARLPGYCCWCRRSACRQSPNR